METLKIKWLKPHPEFAYFAGDQAELETDHVEKLINSGHVILFPGEDKQEVNPLNSSTVLSNACLLLTAAVRMK